MTHTYIDGKDDSLENAIARMRESLDSNGFSIIEHTWGNPATHIWWVHIRDAKNPMCFTNGKGATRLAALASALGEFIERLSCNYFYADYYWGPQVAAAPFAHYPDERWFAVTDGVLSQDCPEGLLSPELAKLYDPDAELAVSDLYDINTGITDRGICALPFVRQRDGERLYFPVNIIGNLYVSNGMSAGSTPAEARTQALSEIFERWVKNKIIAEGVSLPEIPDAVLQRFPAVEKNIQEIKDQGYVLSVFDASLGGQFPVIGAALLNPIDGGCLTSFGAHPHFGVALERTITEILQGRELRDLGSFPMPTFDQDLVNDNHNLETHFIDSTGLVSWNLFSERSDYPFADWDFSGDSLSEFDFLCTLLHDQGADVYIADYDYLGVYACRILVPGISEIYPPEELTHYNNNIANSVRDTILNLAKAQQEDIESVLAWLDSSELDDSERVSQVLGLVIEDDNAWCGVRLGELRCYCYLALGCYDDALDMVEWVQTFASDAMNDEKCSFFRCLREVLLVHLDDNTDFMHYQSIFTQLFGEEVVAAATGHINGNEQFYNLPSYDLSYDMFDNHAKWLSRYQEWLSVKATGTNGV